MVMTERTKVLVVEDDAALRGLLTDVLDHEGYTVLEAERGLQGLRLAQEHEPSLVLTDQTLPGMSGLELLEELRAGEGTRHIPVVLISGFSVEILGGEPHPDRILAKPFDLDALLAHIESLIALGGRRQPAGR